MSSIGGKVPELAPLAVPVNDLECAEYCFRVEIEFAIKPKSDPDVKNLKKILVALLNTAGGIIHIYSKHNEPVKDLKLDDWKRDFESQLKVFIKSKLYISSVRIIELTIFQTTTLQKLCILVKKSPELITLNSFLYTRQAAGNTTLYNAESIRHVMEQNPSHTNPQQNNPLFNSHYFTYGDQSDITEGQNVEFKHWESAKHFKDYRSKLQDERTRQNLFSLPNLSSGGDLVIGITEDRVSKSYKIEGQRISESDEKELKKFLSGFLEKDKEGKRRIWGTTKKYLKSDRNWSVHFIPVKGHPNNEKRHLIRIHFNFCSGGVFEYAPEAYEINAEGQVVLMPFATWIKTIKTTKCEKFNVLSGTYVDAQTQTEHVEHVPHKDNIHGSAASSHMEPHVHQGICIVCQLPFEQQAENIQASQVALDSLQQVDFVDESGNQFSQSDLHDDFSFASCVPKEKVEATHVEPGALVTSQRALGWIAAEHYSQSLEKSLSGLKALHWSKSKPNWRDNLIESTLDKTQNILSFIENCCIFKTATPLNFTPRKETILASHATIDPLSQALDEIERWTPHGFAIAARRWSINIEDLKLFTPNGHIMDVLSVEIDGSVDFWSIASDTMSDNDEILCWKYVMEFARFLKRKLVIESKSDRAPSVNVRCHLYKLPDSSTHKQSKMMSGYFSSSEDDLNMIKEGIASLLLTKPTNIKDILGQSRAIYLTSEQMEQIILSDLDRFNLIEAPPGSGKTYLALYLCEKFTKVGYGCTTPQFYKFLEFQFEKYKVDCKPKPILIRNEDELHKHLIGHMFDDLDYIIIDDVHNIPCSRDTWYQLFYYVHSNISKHLFLFTDSRFQNFKSSDDILPVRIHFQEFCNEHNIPSHTKTLRTVHRNTKKIVSFIITCFEDDESKSDVERIAASHINDGDEIQICDMRHIFNKRSSKNELVRCVKRLLDPIKKMAGQKHSYEATDIVILVDTDTPVNDVQKLIDIFQKQGIEVHDAGTFPVTGITIDTLENFVGFDRNVCMCITSCTSRRIHDPKYKAYVTSRGISRVMFVIDTPLDANIHAAMKMGTVPELKLQWTNTEENEITSLCFLERDNGKLSILYKCEGEQDLKLVNVKDQQAPLSATTMSHGVLAAVNTNHDVLAVVHCSDWIRGPWWMSFWLRKNINWEKQSAYSGMHEMARDIAVTNNGDVVMIAGKMPHCSLKKYSVEGKLIWDKDGRTTRLEDPRALTVGHDDTIYILERSYISIVNPQGEFVEEIGIFNDGCAICIDSNSQWLFVYQHKSQRVDNVILIDTETDSSRSILDLAGTSMTCCMSLHQNKYLAISTNNELHLCNASDLLL